MALTKLQIQTKIDSYLVENTSGSITPTQVKEIFTDIVEAYLETTATAADSNNLEGLSLNDVIGEVISNLGQQVFFTGGYIDDSQIHPSITRDSELAAAIAALVDSSPSTLNTLNELAAALGDDPNYATTITNALANKINVFDFRFLPKAAISAADYDNPTAVEIKAWNDLTDPEVRLRNCIIRYTGTNSSANLMTYSFWIDNSFNVIKLSQPNQQPTNWNATSGPTCILNKPSTFTPASHGHVLAEVSGLIAALAAKADLSGGFILDSQIPASITRDSELAAAVAALVDSSPAALNTLNELAAALGDDPNFATTITNALSNKIDKFNTAFISSSAIAPAVPLFPSVAEITAYCSANSIRNRILYYNQTTVSSAQPTHIYYVDNAGFVLNFLGRKKQLFVPTGYMELVTGTTPTTTAATRVLIGNTGVNQVSLSGAADQGFSFQFIVPDDFASSGILKMCYTVAASSTGNFVIYSVQTQASDNYSTSDGSNSTGAVAMTSASNSPHLELNIPLTFDPIPGSLVTIRVYRPASDVLDTSAQAVFVTGFKFQYQ